ncbi:MAG: hypothetical protein HFE63_03425 [Clostridiales bacterium]|nr:hypothetical protein [Clostridiales bacterium]
MAVDGNLNFNTKIDPSGFEQGTDKISDEAKKTGEEVSDSVDKSSKKSTESVDKAAEEIRKKIDDVLNNTEKSATAKATAISWIYRKNGMSASEAMSKAWDDVGRSENKSIKGSKTASEKFKKSWLGSLNKIKDAFKETAETTKSNYHSILPTVKSSFSKLEKLIVSVFSSAAIIKFGKDALESAAAVNAAESQFEQTFGAFQSSAAAAINRVASESGILETRLRSTATSIYAFAKTAKMESTQALSFMEEALQVAADSAAYYDRSLEDTTETLKSFLKGNYANDAALGLSVTETTRNAKATELYGKKFADLSEAQKQLTLLEMVKDANRLSGALGQAARESEGWENVLGNLKEAWRQLLAVVGQPVLKLALPVVKSMTSALQRMTEAAQTAWQALQRVFGWEDVQATAISSAAEAQDELTAAVEATEKAQEGALAGFDEIQTLTDKSATSETEAASQGTSQATVSYQEIEAVDSVQLENVNRLATAIDSLRILLAPAANELNLLWASLEPLQYFSSQAMTDFYNNALNPIGTWVLGTGLPTLIEIIRTGTESINWENISQSLNQLWLAITPFSENIGEGLLWLFKNIFIPFGTWILNDAAPVFIELLAEAFNAFNSIYEAVKPGLEWIWENWLVPIAEWTGGQIVQIMEDFKGSFEDLQKVISGDMTLYEMIKNMSDLEAIIVAVIAAIAIYNAVTAIAAIVTNTTLLPIILVIAAIAALIAIIILCVKHWDDITAAVSKAWEKIKNTCKGIADWFNEKVIQPIGDFFKGLWKSIKVGFVNFINAIIDGINSLIEGFLFPINALIDGWNATIGLAVGEIPEIKIAIPNVKVPALASGAVIPPNREFLAVLGDQKQGTNIEAPLETIKQAFREAMAESGSSTTRHMTVILQVGRRELGRTIVELGREEEQRVGLRVRT